MNKPIYHLLLSFSLLVCSGYAFSTSDEELEAADRTITSIHHPSSMFTVYDYPYKMALNMNVEGPNGRKLRRYALKEGQEVILIIDRDSGKNSIFTVTKVKILKYSTNK
jgi:hypothetical protein